MTWVSFINYDHVGRSVWCLSHSMLFLAFKSISNSHNIVFLSSFTVDSLLTYFWLSLNVIRFNIALWEWHMELLRRLLYKLLCYTIIMQNYLPIMMLFFCVLFGDIRYSTMNLFHLPFETHSDRFGEFVSNGVLFW